MRIKNREWSLTDTEKIEIMDQVRAQKIAILGEQSFERQYEVFRCEANGRNTSFIIPISMPHDARQAVKLYLTGKLPPFEADQLKISTVSARPFVFLTGYKVLVPFWDSDGRVNVGRTNSVPLF